MHDKTQSFLVLFVYVKVEVPALPSGGEDLSHPGTPLQLWDSTVASLVQSSIKPRCDTAGGDLYIVTGAGRLQAAEDEDNKCQAGPLWSAVCCAAPEGQGGFTAGLIRESDDGERQVSVKELEEMLGLEELFSGGCGDSVEIPAGVYSDTAAGDAEKVSDSSGDSKEEVAGLDTVSNDAIEESDEALTTEGRAAGVDAQQETSDVEDAATSEELGESQPTSAAVSESPEAVPEDQAVDEKDKDTNSSSTLVYLLSTTVSILTLPLRPIFSTVTQLPGQVNHSNIPNDEANNHMFLYLAVCHMIFLTESNSLLKIFTPLLCWRRFWYFVVGWGPRISLTASTMEAHGDCEIKLTETYCVTAPKCQVVCFYNMKTLFYSLFFFF